MNDYFNRAFSLATCTLDGDERKKAFKELEKIQKELEDATQAYLFLEEQQKDSASGGKTTTSPTTNKPS